MRSIEPTVVGAKNSRVRRLRQLSSRTKARSVERAFVVDGPVLTIDALRSDLVVEEVFASPSIWDERELYDAVIESARIVSCYEVEPSVLEAALDPVNPRPVAAVVTQPEWTLEDLAPDRPVLVAVELRDPGNLGTIVRTSEAAGFAGVIMVGDSVDPYSPKAVRASAGSVLRTPVVRLGDVESALAAIKDRGWSVQAAVVDPEAEPYDRVDLTTAAIVVGNEPHGLSAETIKLGDGRFTIPLSQSVESLNVAAAASVLCFEAARQRRAASDGPKTVGQPGREPSS